MKMNFRRFGLAARLLALPAMDWLWAAETESAAPTGTNEISVESLVQEALAKNPELNFYKAEIAAAKGERRTAEAWANPELAGTAGSKRSVAPGASGEGLAWSVMVRQTFEWPGRIPLRKAIANKQIRLAELGYEQFRAALEARARGLAL